jgi:uncharacterized protein (UPF0264 family)
MTALLVSVRSASEARTALAGGAALIDVKEPARGSLGRADENVIHEVVAAVAGRQPVSAALGEWAEDIGTIPDADLTYVKWGLAGCACRPDWRDSLGRWLERPQRPQLVLTAYADWQCARAPAVEEVFALAAAHPGSVLLLDTHCKDAANALGKPRPTLLDWLPAPWIADLCARCRDARVRIALAGSLGPAEMRALADSRPDWFAVRGAVCDGDRHGTVQVEKVRQLVKLATAN